MDKSSKTILERFDWTLAFILLLFFVISLLAIHSAQGEGNNYLIRQIAYYIVGIFIVAACMFFDSFQYRKLSWILYGFGILLLVLLIIAPESIAKPVNGQKNWFQIRYIGSIQPSEFMKIFLILALSKLIVTHQEKDLPKTTQTDLQLFFKLGITSFVPFVLIGQEDLGTALVIFAIFVGMVLVSGISWKIIGSFFAIIAAGIAGVLYMVIYAPNFLQEKLKIPPYQFDRIYSWLDPEAFQATSGYNLYKSLQAIGSGLLTGKGFGERAVYIPEAHTDFIFSVIGEEYGFIGASIVIGLYFILIYHLTKIALETIDPFNTYVIAGIITMISFHVFQNIGMTIQVLPIAGIPLPFISYGGSSLMGNMLAMGIVFSIKYHHKTYMFSSDSKK